MYSPYEVGFLIGSPGSGKSIFLESAPRAHFRVASSSEALRKYGNNSIRSLMLRSPFVPEEASNPLLEKYIMETEKCDLILDSFARTIDQYLFIKSVLLKKGYKEGDFFTIHVKAPRHVAQARMLEIRRRANEDQNMVKHRLDHYEKMTLPLVAHLRKTTRFFCFDNSGNNLDKAKEKAWHVFGQLRESKPCGDPECLCTSEVVA